MVMVLPG